MCLQWAADCFPLIPMKCPLKPRKNTFSLSSVTTWFLFGCEQTELSTYGFFFLPLWHHDHHDDYWRWVLAAGEPHQELRANTAASPVGGGWAGPRRRRRSTVVDIQSPGWGGKKIRPSGETERESVWRRKRRRLNTERRPPGGRTEKTIWPSATP